MEKRESSLLPLTRTMSSTSTSTSTSTSASTSTESGGGGGGKNGQGGRVLTTLLIISTIHYMSQSVFGCYRNIKPIVLSSSLSIQPYYNNNNNFNNNNKDSNHNKNGAGHYTDRHGNPLIAILHAGPHKTGSTAIQSALNKTKFKTILEQEDDFVLLPYNYFSGYCFFRNPEHDESQYCPMSQYEMDEYQSLIQHATTHGKHIMYSNEALELTDRFNLTKLSTEFLPNHQIYVSVVYRRYFEWIVSLHGQYYRSSMNWNEWPKLSVATTTTTTTTPQTLHGVPPIIHYLTRDEIKQKFEESYSVRTYATYNELFPNRTYMINYHDYPAGADIQDVVTSFVCHEHTRTPHLCNAQLQQVIRKVAKTKTATTSTTNEMNDHNSNNKVTPAMLLADDDEEQHDADNDNEEESQPPPATDYNPGFTTTYDEILIAAYAKGLLPSNITKYMGREYARWAVQDYIETNILSSTLASISTSTLTTNETVVSQRQRRRRLQHHHHHHHQHQPKQLPMICLNDDLLQYILDISLYVEQQWYPAFFRTNRGEASLRADFEKYKTTKLCSVDSDAVFEQYPHLVDFLSHGIQKYFEY